MVSLKTLRDMGHFDAFGVLPKHGRKKLLYNADANG